ncbi:MAG: trehalose-6-phosphate synthase, partial [Proteobacteria bacterium]|nr:trehalose-6-phosphate synthase [Pseudomonadota bacterium]
MFHILLYQPEIPPNTGNVIRLAANTGCTLHLVEPLGFSMDDKLLRRAGLDYHEYAKVRRHAGWGALLQAGQPERMFAMTTHGTRRVHEVAFLPGDWLVFGAETRGLAPELRERVTFLFVCTPSRSNVPAYAALEQEVGALVTGINARFGTDDWTPIVLINSNVDADLLAAVYRAA